MRKKQWQIETRTYTSQGNESEPGATYFFQFEPGKFGKFPLPFIEERFGAILWCAIRLATGVTKKRFLEICKRAASQFAAVPIDNASFYLVTGGPPLPFERKIITAAQIANVLGIKDESFFWHAKAGLELAAVLPVEKETFLLIPDGDSHRNSYYYTQTTAKLTERKKQ